MRKSLVIASIVTGTLVALALAGAMVGSRQANAGPSASLDGTEWVLVSWADTTDLPGAQITLKIEDGRLSGSSACNRYMAPVTLDSTTFRTGLLASTEMYCFETADAETTYVTLLQSVSSWQMDGGQLVLSSDTVEVLRFDPAT